jgi:sigma-E factor negative regulatory protein RseA
MDQLSNKCRERVRAGELQFDELFPGLYLRRELIQLNVKVSGRLKIMNERIRESLSALMDDEANELELERVLSQLHGEPRTRETWLRFNQARNAMHGEPMAHQAWDISARVQSCIADDQSASSSSFAEFKQRMMRPLISVAVAASVTATVVIGGQQIAQIDAADPYGASQSVAADASPVGMLNSLGAVPMQASYGMQAVPVLQPATRTAYQDLALQRQRKYMQEHAEQAALNSPQGLVPFARVPEIRP